MSPFGIASCSLCQLPGLKDLSQNAPTLQNVQSLISKSSLFSMISVVLLSAGRFELVLTGDPLKVGAMLDKGVESRSRVPMRLETAAQMTLPGEPWRTC